MRIIFMGTPDFAVASLEAIIHANFEVVAVVTAPDKPAGRGLKLQETPVKKCALSHHIPVLQPTKLKDPAFLAELKSYQADIQVVVAFRMLPEVVWNMPPKGTFNLHGSLLPDYRGAAPINWAIIRGEKVTGVTTFFIEQAIDTGQILLAESTPIGENETAGELHDRLMEIGAALVVKTLQQITSESFTQTPQHTPDVEKIAPKLFKETCQINWNNSSQAVHDFIRGLSPYPAAWTSFQGKIHKIYRSSLEVPTDFEASTVEIIEFEDKTIRTNKKTFWQVKCNDGWLSIVEIQAEGKKRLSIEEYLRGYRW